jgi:hypothetical protein
VSGGSNVAGGSYNDLATSAREAAGAGRFDEALSILQRWLAQARVETNRSEEKRALEHLRATLEQMGDRRRAELIRHYQRVGFRAPLGYD